MIDLHDLTLPTPAENLALDQALLEACEEGEAPESLRFWEPEDVFVVVGYANQADREVNLAACQAAGVPVYRRCTGGGTVVQMPGVLNYNLVLRIPEEGPLSTLTGTNRWVMEQLRAALSDQEDPTRRLTVRGVSDLCLGQRKVMGSAQRRKRSALVFHGCLLLQAELDLMEHYLPFPSHQPDYRSDRSHRDFCANLGMTAEEAKLRLMQAWRAQPAPAPPAVRRIRELVETRYSLPEWNLRTRQA